ncbi:hypothetical protein [Citrobacter braakii]|uniref:GntT/GntP/DsdX family permease n=1 Tax=Citrobacter braakii TaxID=57706 RepID=UPI00398B6D5E
MDTKYTQCKSASHPDRIGAGSIGWAHVTDSAFWIAREYLGILLSEALKKLTGAPSLLRLWHLSPRSFLITSSD